jgi:hypothetical protein
VGTIEERIASVEARAGEHSVMMEAIRQSIDRLDQRLTAMDSRIDHRFTALEAHIGQRCAAIDQRLIGIDQRFTVLEAGLNERFAGLRAEMAHQLRCIAGIQVSVLIGVIGALVSGYFALR